mgnify:CR=1 FL=1
MRLAEETPLDRPTPAPAADGRCSITSLSRMIRLFDALWFVAEHHGGNAVIATVYSDRVERAEEMARMWASGKNLPIDEFETYERGVARRVIHVMMPGGIHTLFKVAFAPHSLRSSDLRSRIDADNATDIARGRR